jgi:hypothetical protein
MTNCMKWMGVFAALAIVAGGTVPALADDTPQWTYTTDWNEGLIIGENFESSSVGDGIFDSGVLALGFGGADRLLINNDNPDMNGMHVDGDEGPGAENGITFAESPGDAGAPTDGAYYIQLTHDNTGGNFSPGVWNSAHGTQYNTTYNPAGGHGWGFGPNGAAHSGGDVFDSENPITAIHKVNQEGGFTTSYSFVAVDLVTGASWGHGGEAGVPNHIPGFGTPTLRLYYDGRGGQNTDTDDYRIGTVPYLSMVPEPATFALLGLGSLFMLRRSRKA